MLAAFADHVVPFPNAGSAAFVKGSADPVTILRRNADGTVLVRRDPRRFERRNRDASGNATLALADLFETADAAALAALPAREHKKARRRAGRRTSK